MTDEQLKADFLWMLSQRPGHYVWIGWLRALPEEHQAWVRAQLGLVRGVVAEREFWLTQQAMWQGLGKSLTAFGDTMTKAWEVIYSAIEPALGQMAPLIEALRQAQEGGAAPPKVDAI